MPKLLKMDFYDQKTIVFCTGGQVLGLNADGQLIVTTEQGDIVLLDANDEKLTERGRISALDGKSGNHPVVADGKRFVRNAEEMACFGLVVRKRGRSVHPNGEADRGNALAVPRAALATGLTMLVVLTTVFWVPSIAGNLLPRYVVWRNVASQLVDWIFASSLIVHFKEFSEASSA